ncbi:MAG: DUF4856 domain-containing protein [Rhizobiales bacterium NRL2]|jgi:hypothetical protein|nr:MAG: DUF4856 domain-containing protein [Rhizobiales bacterium NRL2]
MKHASKIAAAAVAIAALTTAAQAEEGVYAGFPVTVKGYSGDRTHSVSYTGQAARNVLHDSLKKLAGKGASAEEMLSYYEGKGPGRTIIAPASKNGFPILQSTVDEISGDKNIAGKTYKGAILGWPNALTGPEVVSFWIGKAVGGNGVDLTNGYDYAQLISKFIMGAMNYNQAVDDYLDENLEADKKPNDKPYSDGAAYTGKEHSWDEAFGYFGAPAHAMKLTPAQVYDIAKQNPEALAAADHNGDGKVDLRTEMTFGPAYYAAGFDKGGKTEYLHGIVGAFLEGRKLIAAAGGEKLTDAQRAELKAHAATIDDLWSKVLAEAVFKYAGSVYKDLGKLKIIMDARGETDEVFGDYVKHWGELKGFSLALQTGRENLGETAVRMNRLIGFGPWLLNSSQVVDVDSDGNYLKGQAVEMGEYMLHMLKLQKLMVDEFGIEARNNDMLADIKSLAGQLGNGASAEND